MHLRFAVVMQQHVARTHTRRQYGLPRAVARPCEYEMVRAQFERTCAHVYTSMYMSIQVSSSVAFALISRMNVGLDTCLDMCLNMCLDVYLDMRLHMR